MSLICWFSTSATFEKGNIFNEDQCFTEDLDFAISEKDVKPREELHFKKASRSTIYSHWNQVAWMLPVVKIQTEMNGVRGVS